MGVKIVNTILKNGVAMAEIKKAGAEIVSFKRLEDGTEYMWNGDETFWPSHAPVLFPIVCAVVNGEIRVDGKTYQIGNHGFAKWSEFELVEESGTKAVFKLTYNEETLTKYPFKFDLFITYTLVENKLEVKYKVDNIDDKDIYFQIGTHPGFNCPLDKDTQFEDYYLEFEKEETLERFFMDKTNVVISGKSDTLIKDSKILPLTHELFYDGALVFKNINSSKVTLKSKKSAKNVVLSYENLPTMGIWQPKNAPFVCIEPWYGLADTDDYTGEFKDRDRMIHLKRDESFECLHVIEMN
jgi:galactose mutarotase-like enzyme